MRGPTSTELRAFLRRLGHAIAAGSVGTTDYADSRTADELRWTKDQLVRWLGTLVPEDFHRREVSTSGSGTVWTFEPWTEHGYVWVRLIEGQTGWRVISCHLSEVTGEE